LRKVFLVLFLRNSFGAVHTSIIQQKFQAVVVFSPQPENKKATKTVAFFLINW
jgi:hypothetical protein